MSRLIALDVPEAQEEIAEWLESIICGGDLRGLVAQLSGIHEPPAVGAAESLNLEGVLSELRGKVLSDGLVSLPLETLQSLLADAPLLLDLQELVILEGGEHWQKQFRAGADRRVVETTRNQLREAGAGPQVEIPAVGKPRWKLAAIAALAATVLMVLSVWYAGEPEQDRVASGWGWSAVDGLPDTNSDQEYLAALSAGASAWSNKRPTNKTELRRRLAEFKAGCELLLAAEHTVLTTSDRSWLLYKCRGWRNSLAEQLVAVDAASFDEALAAGDQLAAEIAETLQERAEALSS